MQTSLSPNTPSHQQANKNKKINFNPNETLKGSIMSPIPCLIQQPKINSFVQIPNIIIKNYRKKKGCCMNTGLAKPSCFCAVPVNPYFYCNKSKPNKNMKTKNQINMNQGFKKCSNGNIRMNAGFNPSFGCFNQKSRVPFSPEEDEKIRELTQKHGTRQWSLIASFLVGRTPKQCRDRYANYLVPGYVKGEWSNEEDQLLTKLYIQYGPKWSVIQKLFPGRSANSIKNRWNYFLCRQNKNDDDFEKKSKSCQGNYEVGMKKNNMDNDLANSNNDENLFLTQNDEFANNHFIQLIDPISDVLQKEKDEFFGYIDQENEMLEILNNEMIGLESEWSIFN